jgi:hypothetical protein
MGKYRNRKGDTPWIFKNRWNEPYTKGYDDADNGIVGDDDQLGDDVNALVMEGREFSSASEYATYKTSLWKRDLGHLEDSIGNPRLLGVRVFRGKHVKPDNEQFFWEGDWPHDEMLALAKKRGVRVEWIDPEPLVRKSLASQEKDMMEAFDFYANRWHRLVKPYPVVLKVYGTSTIHIHAFEDIPDDLGGPSILGWVEAFEHAEFGDRCDNTAIDMYPSAARWFVAVSHVLSTRRREGIGIKMYEALFDEVAKISSPALVAPEDCWTMGGTSDMAKGLWKAIYPRHDHVGEYVILGGDGRERKKQAAAKCDGMVETRGGVMANMTNMAQRVAARHLKALGWIDTQELAYKQIEGRLAAKQVKKTWSDWYGSMQFELEGHLAVVVDKPNYTYGEGLKITLVGSGKTFWVRVPVQLPIPELVNKWVDAIYEAAKNQPKKEVDPPKKVVPKKVDPDDAKDTIAFVAKFLKGLDYGPAGDATFVRHDKNDKAFYITTTKDTAQNEWYVDEDEDDDTARDEASWDVAYKSRIISLVQRALNRKFGGGVLTVDVDRTGAVSVDYANLEGIK